MLLDLIYRYRYTANPEGTKPFEKLFGLCKYGLAIGVGWGMYDCTLQSATTTVKDTFRVIAYHTIPITGMCAAFASTAYIMADLRGKDDYYNYIVGVLPPLAVFHKWKKNTQLTLHLAPLFILFGLSMRYMLKQDFSLPMASRRSFRRLSADFPDEDADPRKRLYGNS